MGKGDLIKNPDRRVKLLLIIQALWVTTLIVLILWWSTVIRQKSDEIAALQTQLGVPESQIQSQLVRTERMITGESGSLFLLIMITNGILFFFFIRDHKRSKSLQAFFASITHELRTPLTSIKLQAEALQDIITDASHGVFINRLLEDIGRLEGEVQKTLELARIEGGGTLNLQAIHVSTFFNSKIIPNYTPQKMKLEYRLDDAFITADLTALTIIFRNIFDNAIKYTQSQPAVLNISGTKNGERYTFTIQHQNSNFKGETEHLGKLFYRGQNSLGAGVGLYLIQTLMNNMKGSATFQANTNEFTSTLHFEVDHGT